MNCPTPVGSPTTAGRHAKATTVPTVAAPDSFAFAVGHDDDPDQLRGFWIRTGDSAILEITGQSGDRLYLPLWQIPALASLLTAADAFAPYLTAVSS